MTTRNLKSAIIAMAGAFLFTIGSVVMANAHMDNHSQSDGKSIQKSSIETPVNQEVRYAILTKAEPKSGWCGFNDRLARNIRYPEYLKHLGIEGTINVHFVVDKEGNIYRIRTSVANEINASESNINALKEEAKRAVMASFGEWRPSTLDGRPVASSTYIVPVNFKYDFLSIR